MMVIANWLNCGVQGAVVSSTKSSWKAVTGGVPQDGSRSYTVNYFHYSLGDKAEHTHRNFLEDTKLGGVVDKPEDCADVNVVGTDRRIEPTGVS